MHTHLIETAIARADDLISAIDSTTGQFETEVAALSEAVSALEKALPDDANTSADADRLLQLGDEFLDQWTERAVKGGERDADYEARFAAWQSIRPLFAAAPEMLRELRILKACCEEALSGAWDRSNDGFYAMLEGIDAVITKATSE